MNEHKVSVFEYLVKNEALACETLDKSKIHSAFTMHLSRSCHVFFVRLGQYQLLPDIVHSDWGQALKMWALWKRFIDEARMAFDRFDDNTTVLIKWSPLVRVSWTKNPDTGYPHGGSNMKRRAVVTYKEITPPKNRCHITETQIRCIEAVRRDLNYTVCYSPVTRPSN